MIDGMVQPHNGIEAVLVQSAGQAEGKAIPCQGCMQALASCRSLQCSPAVDCAASCCMRRISSFRIAD